MNTVDVLFPWTMDTLFGRLTIGPKLQSMRQARQQEQVWPVVLWSKDFYKGVTSLPRAINMQSFRPRHCIVCFVNLNKSVTSYTDETLCSWKFFKNYPQWETMFFQHQCVKHQPTHTCKNHDSKSHFLLVGNPFCMQSPFKILLKTTLVYKNWTSF